MRDYSNFFENVYEVVRNIPKGRVTSYGAIARFLGLNRSARMVGWAMNHAHNLEGIPAHRVVNRNGRLTGKSHFDESNEMQQLLEDEGIKIENDEVVNFENLFWDPTKELGFD